MAESVKLFHLAQLAEASYALFDEFDNDNDGIASAIKAKGFSLTQANEFVANWRVVSHRPNTTSGYSGTLFQYIGNDPNSGFVNGQFVFSLRGTEPEFFINSLDLGADIGDIVLDGLAMEQIVDMYNHWKQVTTPAGQSYQLAKLIPDFLVQESLTP